MGPLDISWSVWREYAAALALALAAFILVSVWAWKGNVAVVRSWKDWWANRHERRRFRTDPAYRLMVTTVAEYTETFMRLHLMRAMTDAEPDSHWRTEKYLAVRDEAARFMSGLDAERQGLIAEHMRQNLFDGKVPLEDIRAWFAEEVEYAKCTPYMVANHANRCAHRFYDALGLSEPPELAAEKK